MRKVWWPADAATSRAGERRRGARLYAFRARPSKATTYPGPIIHKPCSVASRRAPDPHCKVASEALLPSLRRSDLAALKIRASNEGAASRKRLPTGR